MPLFDVRADFALDTEIEVDLGYNVFDRGVTEEFSDESYFSTQSVEADGGSLLFVVDTSSEEEAEEMAREVIFDGMEVEDDNGLTWQVSNVSFDIEEREIPMDAERAKLLVTEYLDSMEGMDDELKLAFSFLLELVVVQRTEIATLQGKVTDQRSEITRLDSLVARQSGEIDRLTNGPDGSEAPETIGLESN